MVLVQSVLPRQAKPTYFVVVYNTCNMFILSISFPINSNVDEIFQNCKEFSSIHDNFFLFIRSGHSKSQPKETHKIEPINNYSQNKGLVFRVQPKPPLPNQRSRLDPFGVQPRRRGKKRYSTKNKIKLK